MGVEYLVAGALITCPLGTKQEQVLLIPDDHGTYVGGKLVAREIDCEPIKNIAPFGICTFTQKPCFPDFAEKKWINTHADSCLTGGKEAATTESRLYCLTGKNCQFQLIQDKVQSAQKKRLTSNYGYLMQKNTCNKC